MCKADLYAPRARGAILGIDKSSDTQPYLGAGAADDRDEKRSGLGDWISQTSTSFAFFPFVQDLQYLVAARDLPIFATRRLFARPRNFGGPARHVELAVRLCATVEPAHDE